MMSGRCSMRALWILSAQDVVLFSRRFPVVERRWRMSCEREAEQSDGGCAVVVRPLFPTDAEISAALAERREREGSIYGSGLRINHSRPGSDSWVDDPITRHTISLSISKDGEKFLLWPLVLHKRGHFCIVILPLVEPHHLKSYERIVSHIDHGGAVEGAKTMSTLLLHLPCITGAFMVAHTIGDIITGDSGEPDLSASPISSVGGLLDSLTGSIGISGISTRVKPVSAPVPASTSGVSASGFISADALKSMSPPLDKEALRTFISISMPFGTPLDLNFSNIFAIKTNGFSPSDVPPQDLKQPAWKPYLYKGKQRIQLSMEETISAAMYDRDDIADSVTVSGQIICRAELEGLPDVSCHLAGANTSGIKVLSFHPCAQVPEHGLEKQSVVFTPPLGNFVLMRYQGTFALKPPVKGFYQLSMVSEDEGAFLFKLLFMEGYKIPLTMDFCTVTMPFPRRKLTSFEGTPPFGTVSTTENSVDWKVVTSGRGITGKNIEATFSGTVKFSPLPVQGAPLNLGVLKFFSDDDGELEPGNSGSIANIEEYLIKKMNTDIGPVYLEEPFCWQAYDYAKVSFRISGGTLSGVAIDPKSVSIYPSVKASVELSAQASSGDYILWNTLGKCPSTAMPKET